MRNKRRMRAAATQRALKSPVLHVAAEGQGGSSPTVLMRCGVRRARASFLQTWAWHPVSAMLELAELLPHSCEACERLAHATYAARALAAIAGGA